MTVPAIAEVIGAFTNDLKVSYIKADHAGWYICNGRALATLSVNAKAQAIASGFTTNLPNVGPSALAGSTAVSRTYIYLGS
ncbi:MAG: hypothetical protein ACEQSC_00675 [Candidatus Nanopelagicaceae bacterium]